MVDLLTTTRAGTFASHTRARGVRKLVAKVGSVDQYACDESCPRSDFAHAREALQKSAAPALPTSGPVRAREAMRNVPDRARRCFWDFRRLRARARPIGKFANVEAIGTYVGTQVGTGTHARTKKPK